jgi:hypothetical protein
VTDLIDPDELPFTVDEVFEAGRRFLPEDAARRMADHLADCAPALILARDERRAGWRKAGLPNADRNPLHGWVYPEELLPSLAGLSPELSVRVARLCEYLGIDHRDPAV